MNEIKDPICYSLVYPVEPRRLKSDPAHVLLGFQKSGKWEGYYNGFGGKIQEDEDPRESARRELREETGMTIFADKLKFSGMLCFEHCDNNWASSKVYVYTCPWHGFTPLENEVCVPQRFNLEHLPYNQMPPADRHWLPQILIDDKQIDARFIYNTNADGEEFLETLRFSGEPPIENPDN